MKRPELRPDGLESVEEAAAEPPAPAVVPGSIEWASAVGNQTVARLAAARQAAPAEEASVEEAPAEEAPVEEPAAEEAPAAEEPAGEDAEAAAAMADVDEEQLPE